MEAVSSLTEIEGDLDLAVLVVPARAAPLVAAQAAEKGVRAIVVLAGGFAETGDEGAALQAELVEAAGQVRIVGPNCFGVQNMAIGLNASMTAAGSHEPGGIALITQSGAYGMAIHAMAPDEHLRFGKVYSSGNKADIGDHEAIRYLHADPGTDIICLLAESVTDGAELAAAIRAATPTKPVIIAKTGRSEAGARAARSHTGSLGSDDAIFRAAMRQAGAISVRTGLEMLEAARLLAGQPLPEGARAAIITNSGGTGVELVDLLAAEGVDVPELSPALQARIAKRIPPFASPRNPVDITPIWPRFAELYPWLVDALARSGEVDLVIPVLLQRAAMDEATVAGNPRYGGRVTKRRDHRARLLLLGGAPRRAVQGGRSSSGGYPLPRMAGANRPIGRVCGSLRRQPPPDPPGPAAALSPAARPASGTCPQP